ncbi:hypothetical protein ACFPN4_07270 [Ureibacillus thermophilus]|uniref:hypothetical protein n=1 Tax=Ureibacillus thermophilus TaxID=367743 RepID=UPI003622D7D9
MNNHWISNNYLEYINENFPKFFNKINKNDIELLKKLFFTINDIYITCTLFDSCDFKNKNYINLIKEFKTYMSRVLLVIPLNDKYLIDSIFRLLIEKLYRIIYALYHPHLLESSIRKHERRKMSNRLNGKITMKSEMDILYKNFSDLIHHSTSTTTDLLNFKQLANANTGIINYTLTIVEEIKKIYTFDFLIPILKNVPLDLATKLMFSNELQKFYAKILEPNIVMINEKH